MPLRMNLLAPGFSSSFNFPGQYNQPTVSAGGTPWWGTLLTTGVGALGAWLASRGQRTSTTGPTFDAGFAPTSAIPAIGAGALAATLARYGLTVAGAIISGARSAWAKVPALVKAAATALGLTFVADSAAESLFGDDNGAPRRRRGKGITATELRGFNKVGKLLRKVGMRPKVLGGGGRRFGKVCK